MKLAADDEVVALELVDPNKQLLVISEKGYGKRTNTKDYRLQTRGGKGVKTYKISEKTGILVGAKAVYDDEEIMIINSDGSLIRMSVSQISVLSRVTSGVKVMRTDENSLVVALARIVVPKEDENI